MSLDIVQLIEKSPLTRLNKDYQTKLLTKIKTTFTDSQQQLFVASFYCYLNHNSKSDFVISLENVWKWCGFSRVDPAKVVLKKNFIENLDYKVSAPEVAGANKKEKRGGHNKETVLMTVNTFKKFCLKAGTKKADEIHDYYIKLEELLQDTMNEESNELRNQLEIKQLELEKTQKQLQQKSKLKVKKWYDSEPGHTIYALKSNQQDSNSLITIGKSKDISKREGNYHGHNQESDMFYVKRCYNCDLAEKVLHHMLDKYRMEKNQEWFSIPESLAIYTINLVCNFLDNFITVIEKLPKTKLQEEITKITQTLTHQIEEKQIEIKEQKIEQDNSLDEFDYDKFIKEKCVLNESYSCIPEELLGAYILWCRKNVDSSRRKLLYNNLKTKFKMEKKYLEIYKSKIQLFIGIKPINLKHDIDDSKLYDKFLKENCDIGYTYKITEKDFLSAISKWSGMKLSTDQLIEIKAYFNKDFYFGNINISKEKKKFGYVGFKLKTSKETIHCLRNKYTRGVVKININTKHIEKEFVSINEAAHMLNIAYRTAQSYLKLNKIFDECYVLQYKELE
jgi:hypothetical protein